MSEEEYKLINNDFISELAQYFPPGTTTKEMLEIYNDPKQFEQYMQALQNHYAELQTNYSVYQECVIPIATQMWDQIWQILFFCLLLRLLSVAKLPRLYLNVLSTVMGVWLLWQFYEKAMLFCLVPALVVLLFLQVSGRTNGLLLSLVVTVYLIACETTLLDQTQWNKIKGSVMIVFMKIISISFDVEHGIIPDMLTMHDLYGYVFNPASIIFGPFLTFKDYELLFNRSKMSISWLFYCTKCLVMCVFCLLWSSCGTTNYLPKVSSIVPQLEDNRWWTAYAEAQTFRFSHYFVSYFSEASCLIMGVGMLVRAESKEVPLVEESKVNKKQIEKNSANESKSKELHPGKRRQHDEIIWARPVAHLLPVEAPRSLVDVVTNWNLPMHYWLKQYIFKSTRKFGVFLAILCTYTASSILHGFNFQLSAVLLSIGLFAYVESVFRHLLANVLSACLEARHCKNNCSHIYKKSNFGVMCVNLIFSFVAVWNLAYLGCLFDNSGEEEQGYSMKHALTKWQKYEYMNHLTMLGVFVVQKIISYGRGY